MLSIISTNYNKEDVLTDFFESVYSNGFSDFELIFIDDCSTDSSVKVAEKYPCRIIQNTQNLGPAASRNLASRQAEGSVLLFTDTDITIDPGGLERINRRFLEDGVKAMFGKLAFPPIRNTKIGRFWLYDEEEVCHYGGVKTGMVNCWSSTLGAVDTELFLEIGGFNESFKGADIEDHELAAKILEHHEVFYDEELTFHHYYPSTKLVLKKMFVRSKMFARSSSIKVYKEKSWVSSHRNTSFILSALLALSVVSTALSFFFYQQGSMLFLCLFAALILAKLLHHRLLFKAVVRGDSLSFAFYCFFMLFLTSLFSMTGFAAGLVAGKEYAGE